MQSGYRVSFLPLFIPTHAPVPPEEREKGGYDLPTTSEPIFVGLHEWRKGHWGSDDMGGEYLTFWYVGQIPEDAVRSFLLSPRQKNSITVSQFTGR